MQRCAATCRTWTTTSRQIFGDAAWRTHPRHASDEILRVIHLKAGKPGIRVPLGFLLTAVPKCFKGDSYRQFREERERSREAALERDRLFAAEILKSPEADDEQKQWAREVLAAQ